MVVVKPPGNGSGYSVLRHRFPDLDQAIEVRRERPKMVLTVLYEAKIWSCLSYIRPNYGLECLVCALTVLC